MGPVPIGAVVAVNQQDAEDPGSDFRRRCFVSIPGALSNTMVGPQALTYAAAPALTVGPNQKNRWLRHLA